MSADISRHSLRVDQLYSSVVRQQGRTPLDSEENEASDIFSLRLRQSLAETICSGGTPDGGFFVESVEIQPGDEHYDLTYGAGSFYLGGLRVENGPGSETFADQRDWLDRSLHQDLPDVPVLAAGETRTDLVWLEGWEQHVTAFRGRRTHRNGARRRRHDRAQAADAACAGGNGRARRWVCRSLRRTDPADRRRCRVRSGLRFTRFPDRTDPPPPPVGFVDTEPVEDLCSPRAEPGFLGARNETIRVAITQPGEFVWSTDAALYRVQVEDDDNGNRRRLVFPQRTARRLRLSARRPDDRIAALVGHPVERRKGRRTHGPVFRDRQRL